MILGQLGGLVGLVHKHFEKGVAAAPSAPSLNPPIATITYFAYFIFSKSPVLQSVLKSENCNIYHFIFMAYCRL